MPRSPKSEQPKPLQVGEKWISTVGTSSFEVESVDPVVINVTRRVPNKDGEIKIEKRRRELGSREVDFFTRIYKRI